MNKKIKTSSPTLPLEAGEGGRTPLLHLGEGVSVARGGEVILFAFLFLFFLLPNTAEAIGTTVFWVGGCSTTNWDCNDAGVTNWGSASNTRNNAAVPGTNDVAMFDGVGYGDSPSTISANITIKSLNMTGYANTLTHNANVTLTISGGTGAYFTLASGMTYTLGSASTAAIAFTGTTATTTITTAGKTLGNVTFNGVGGAFKLADTFTASTLTTTQGTWDTDNQTVNLVSVNQGWVGSGARVYILGSSAINISGNWVVSSVVFFSVAANTATLTFTAQNVTFQSGGDANYNGLSVVHNGGGTFLFKVYNSTFKDVTFTGVAGKTGVFREEAASKTPIITGTLTLNGASSTNRLLVYAPTLGTPWILNAANVSASNVDFRDITGAGAASWDLSAITGLSGDAGGNSGITFTTATTTYWMHGSTASENWSDSSNWAWGSGLAGGTGRVPLPQDDVRFDANSFSGTGKTVSLDMPRAGKSIDWTGATNNPTLTTSVTFPVIYGSLTFISGMTFNNSGHIQFEGRAAGMPVGGWTLTSAGKTFPSNLYLNMYGGTLTLQDSFVGSNTLFNYTGTFNANGFNVTVPNVNFADYAGIARTMNMGSGTWTITGTGYVWKASIAPLTLNAQTSTLIISNTTATAKNFGYGGSAKIYNNVIFSGDNIIVAEGNTYNTMAVNNGGLANGLILPTGVSTTTVTNLTTNANSTGSRAIIKSATAGTIAGLKTTLSSNICVDYMSIQDINAYSTGGGKFFAGLNSLNVSGNSGWVWSVSCGNPNYGTRTSSSTPNVKITSSAAAAGAPGWYGAGWNYRKKISINYRKVATTTGPNITNFPMLVSVTDPNLKFTSFGGKVASSTGGDIVFASSNGTTALNYEIEKYASTTGELVAWVQIPFLSSTSTTPIYMYLGNPSAPDVPASTAQNTWDANYKGVWHLPNGTSLTLTDSTSSNNSGTAQGNTAAIAGKIGGAADFDGAGDYVGVSGFNQTLTAATFSAWVKADALVACDGLIFSRGSSVTGVNLGACSAASRIGYHWNDGSGTFGWINGPVASTGVWAYVVLAVNSAGATAYYGLDGGTTLSSASNVAAHASTVINDLRFGQDEIYGTRDFDGKIDEIRISATARSADWILTEYNNQSSPSTFYGYGGLETQTGRVDSSGTVVPVMKIKGGVKFR